MIKNILAKSSGQTLYDHSILVSKFAVAIAKKSLYQDFMADTDEFLNTKLIESARVAGLLHDIGKCTKEFQKKLNKDLSDIDMSFEAKLPYRHNEVGWAFLVKNLKIPTEILNLVLDSVYWHHGISNEMSSYSDIHIKISDEDTKTMLEFLKLIVPDIYVDGYSGKTKKAPNYFADSEVDNYEEVNYTKTFVRMCVISADRLASKHSDIISDEEIENVVLNENDSSWNFDASTHIYKDSERFKEQVSIATTALVGGTVQINAPAGFGKTLLGLMITSPRKRKLIWVCPRNTVAESVYRSILDEIAKTTNNDKLSVELYLTGETKKSTHNIAPFESEIVVTNIDNFLSPSVDNRIADRMHRIINSDVIFDEYHELVTESALFACFINLMMVRHRVTNSFSVLLSATGVNISSLWDTDANKTIHLPEKNKHYQAAHDKKYQINTTDTFNIVSTDTKNLYIFNSIKTAQLNKDLIDGAILVHSDFTDEDKTNLTDKIYALYGKYSERNVVKPSVIGTPIIQASLDISFKNLYESILSPQSTLQRIGRCDRWGDLEGESSINIINLVNRSETSIRNLLYSNNLSQMWFEFISKYNGQKLDLNELYQIYNTFEKENQTVIKQFLDLKYANSLAQLATIHPIKLFLKKTKSDITTTGGKKLRESGGLFVIVKHYDTDNYTEPFSVNIYSSIEDDFNEDDGTLIRIKNTFKFLRDTNDIRFDFNDNLDMFKHMQNNKKLGGWLPFIRNQAKKSNTPYPRFDKVYHPQYGCISLNTLEIINNK